MKKKVKPTDGKTEIMKFRVTPEQKSVIEEKALSSYRVISAYLRDCALGKEIIVINGADKVADELRRIGNNLNQLTHSVNAGMISTVDLSEMRKEVAEVWQSLNALRREAR